MPETLSGNMLPPHQFKPGPTDDSCFVCGLSEEDVLHERQDENKVTGQPNAYGRTAVTEPASWPGLPADVFARLRENYAMPVEEAKRKPAKHKHHFVRPDKLGIKPGTAGWYGSGMCAACGRPGSDPDHDGDVGGGSTPAPAAAPQSAAKETQPKAAAGYDAETEIIRKNKTLDVAKTPHKFHPAEFTQPNGHPRCLLCGDEQTNSGVCSGDPDGIDTDPSSARPTDLPAPIPPIRFAEENDTRQRSYITVTHERVPAPALAKPNWVPDSKGFITEYHGKTLVTAQATVDPALFEKAFTPNDFFMWTQGRLVGAEAANRNGAFWTSGDLELGQATVKYGPLNWLHDGTHVIGTLAEAAFVDPPESADDDAFRQPHIAIVAPVWKWLFPEEADVIQMASEANKFWYSMECISRAVECVGENGCGAQAEYADYVSGGPNSCEHMRDRSATRRFVDPTFLGSAVIVPPVRPGWADANAGVMQRASLVAEKSYDQAGRPSISASDWELLMAQVLLSADA